MTQTPPKYSNIKINGVPARKLARKQIDVKLKSKETMIYHIELIDFHGDIIQFRTCVKSGTYIRSLGAAIAKELETFGHLQALKRVSIDSFSVGEALSGEMIQINHETNLKIFVKEISISKSLYWIPEISLKHEQIDKLKHGQILSLDILKDKADLYKIVDKDQKFYGLALFENNRLIPKKMLPYDLGQK